MLRLPNVNVESPPPPALRSPIPIQFHWMARWHLPHVLQIEQQSSGDPWSEDEFRKQLRVRNLVSLAAVPDEQPDTVVGFLLYELRERSMSIVKLAVHPAVRRRSIGQQMIARMTRKLGKRRQRILARLDERDVTAQLFLRSQGFRATTILCGGGRLDGDDAYLMEFGLQKCTEVRGRA